MKMKVLDNPPGYKLNHEMIIKARKAIAINDEEQKKFELVVCIIFPENAQNLQLECRGIEKCKEWENHNEQRIQKSTLEKEKALT